ncbi:Get3/ArsA fold putative tail anchor-mediating ATPase NosAFP [Roseofilum casamattae]|uniref:ArsA family ATPase n=1 Tax=Roseofilum casamattae BLCC-M143 TaxID=3022442 RepID=A0ABT7BT29_9CYAN|nr:ArsA family ATPase [Roseofilum casamattae]MDJ1182342.1 ArsA family ATPase [Roseofilum casamattae BLCC-M143]
MALILTFLGKGGTGKTTVAIATAKQMAGSGKRVLLVLNEPPAALPFVLGTEVGSEPMAVEPNLEALNLQSTVLLEKGWEDVKELEAKYLQQPFFKEIFGQELGLLPGMDAALAMYAIQEYEKSGKYDTIIYDGDGDRQTLRALGSPEIMSWYVRRFRNAIVNSDIARALSPFIGPVSSAVLNNVDWSSDNFAAPTNEANSNLDLAKAAISDPSKVAVYLVTTADPVSLTKAQYLWGSAQQVGVTVGGVLFNQTTGTADIPEEVRSQFTPLSASVIPFDGSKTRSAVQAALPDFTQANRAPKPMEIDLAAKTVSLFLPGFEKKQVKLTQSGPEITIEAGDQRRNLLLPPPLSGKPVKGAKFQDRYLRISF